jgi:trigger factor
MNKLNLQVEKKELAADNIRLTVTVPTEVTTDVAKGAVLACAMQHKLDLSTVKTGDLDRYVLEQVGEAGYQGFLDEYVMGAVTPYAIEEAGLEVIMDPVVTSSDHLRAGREFVFQAKVRLKPHYELSSYEPVTVNLPPISVSEKEIEEQLAALLESHSVSVADRDTVVKAGDNVLFAIETNRVDTGEPIVPMTAPRRVYTLGEGFLPTAFDEGLLGAKAGDVRTMEFELPGPELPDGSTGEGVPVATKVTILQIDKKTTPKLTDAWVAGNMPGMSTVAELRENIYAAGLRYKKQEQQETKYFYTASALADRMIGSIPDDIYEHTQVELLANLRKQCDAAGITMQDFFKQRGIPEQQFSMQVMLETRERLRQSFSLDALARHLELTLEEADIGAALSKMAPGNEDKARQEFEGTGRGYLLREAAMRTKANTWLVETAKYE